MPSQNCKIVNVKSVGILCSLHVWSPSLAGQIFGLARQSVSAGVGVVPTRRCAALLCRAGATTANSFRWSEDETQCGGMEGGGG